MDIRERSKPWEQESDLPDRRTDRNDRIQRDRSNESRGSGTSRSGRKRDEYDEECPVYENYDFQVQIFAKMSNYFPQKLHGFNFHM